MSNVLDDRQTTFVLFYMKQKFTTATLHRHPEKKSVKDVDMFQNYELFQFVTSRNYEETIKLRNHEFFYQLTKFESVKKKLGCSRKVQPKILRHQEQNKLNFLNENIRINSHFPIVFYVF